jgi:hypothetical protein
MQHFTFVFDNMAVCMSAALPAALSNVIRGLSQSLEDWLVGSLLNDTCSVN